MKAGLLIGFFFCATLLAQDWQSQMEARAEELVRKNGPGKNAAVKKQLLAMREEDQALRLKLFASRDNGTLEKIDRKLTARLKRIVARHGWPTVDLVGIEASQAAGLILVHSPDHDFQRTMLPTLTKLAEEERIVPSDIAIMTDKILVSEGKLQRFGSQFRFQSDEDAACGGSGAP